VSSTIADVFFNEFWKVLDQAIVEIKLKPLVVPHAATSIIGYNSVVRSKLCVQGDPAVIEKLY
jgi:hypothetical protein